MRASPATARRARRSSSPARRCGRCRTSSASTSAVGGSAAIRSTSKPSPRLGARAVRGRQRGGPGRPWSSALWDLQGKALGRPVYDLIGGRTRPALQEVIASGGTSPRPRRQDRAAMKATSVSTCFKIKVGDAPQRDEQRVAAVSEAAGPEARITVDANQGWWDAATAVRAIKLLERPRHRVRGAAGAHGRPRRPRGCVRARVDVPIALDESVRGPRGGAGGCACRGLRHLRRSSS